MRCFNSGCTQNADPDVSLSARVISEDGDFVCGAACEQAVKEKRADFLNNVLPDEAKVQAWLTK
ncbi:MAG: hypothetical protein GY833_22915 [Aestuariibacter sp.]|nr:hypothetical protein [Aestuariibacter sp.]|tara:strand:+ start:192294 stop:192485 length:192 start_codon:yes stop_codon:yes gene_type:complete